jgi:CO dehydrogenase/acetyl-CoA synthase beta subunit
MWGGKSSEFNYFLLRKKYKAMFDKHFEEIKSFLKRKQDEGKVSEFFHTGKISWPMDKNRNLVMAQDTAVELGNPKDASLAFLLWINDPGKLENGKITVIGPDLPKLSGKQASFGKIVMVAGDDFNEDNSFDRYREMELLRYDVPLKGYMMRAVSQYQREWSRVSKEAIDKGFSFKILGGALIDKFLELKYVRAVEVFFITSSREDVLELCSTADEAVKIIGAMNKMAADLSFDCDTCEYNEVCDDVSELRNMHSKLKKTEAAANA